MSIKSVIRKRGNQNNIIGRTLIDDDFRHVGGYNSGYKFQCYTRFIMWNDISFTHREFSNNSKIHFHGYKHLAFCGKRRAVYAVYWKDIMSLLSLKRYIYDLVYQKIGQLMHQRLKVEVEDTTSRTY